METCLPSGSSERADVPCLAPDDPARMEALHSPSARPVHRNLPKSEPWKKQTDELKPSKRLMQAKLEDFAQLR